jgi:hypothetical protein
MVGWAIAIAMGFSAGALVGILVRREKILYRWLRDEVTSLRDEVEEACVDMKALATPPAGQMLDQVEGDDFEIASNLDRMNVLLDQLNGLLKGKTTDRFDFQQALREDGAQRALSEQCDFVSPEELRKFSALPPISEEELLSMDWEYLFRRISSENCE